MGRSGAAQAAGHRSGRAAVGALALALSGGSGAAVADEFRVAGDHLGLRVAPRVGPPSPNAHNPAEVGLASMLRARAETGGPDVAVELDHAGTARPNQPTDAFDQVIGLRGRVSTPATHPDDRLATEIVAGYSTGGLAALETGQLDTAVRLRARPAARLTSETELGWWGRPSPDDDRSWTQGAHGRLGLHYTLPGLGTIGGFERVRVGGPDGRARSFETGVKLDFGPHSFSLSQRLDTVGRRRVGPLAAAATYGWQLGSVSLALSGDYTGASETDPATGFAGLAVSFGFASPGPGALLDALR